MLELDGSFAMLERLVQSDPTEEAATETPPPASTIRAELQQQYDALTPAKDSASRAREIIFLGLVGASLGRLGLEQADFNRMTKSNNVFTAIVTDELLEWLSDRGWLTLR